MDIYIYIYTWFQWNIEKERKKYSNFINDKFEVHIMNFTNSRERKKRKIQKFLLIFKQWPEVIRNMDFFHIKNVNCKISRIARIQANRLQSDSNRLLSNLIGISHEIIILLIYVLVFFFVSIWNCVNGSNNLFKSNAINKNKFEILSWRFLNNVYFLLHWI